MSPTEFLINYWEWIMLGLFILNKVFQKIPWKPGKDFIDLIWDLIKFITAPPKPPSRLSILFIGLFLLIPSLVFAASDVTFEWDSNTEADMVYYNFYRSGDGQATWNKINPSPINHTGMGTETWTDFGVPDGVFSYYATAVDTSENESERSNIVTGSFDTEAPAPPQNLLITLIKKIIAWIMNLFRSVRFA